MCNGNTGGIGSLSLEVRSCFWFFHLWHGWHQIQQLPKKDCHWSIRGRTLIATDHCPHLPISLAVSILQNRLFALKPHHMRHPMVRQPKLKRSSLAVAIGMYSNCPRTHTPTIRWPQGIYPTAFLSKTRMRWRPASVVEIWSLFMIIADITSQPCRTVMLFCFQR